MKRVLKALAFFGGAAVVGAVVAWAVLQVVKTTAPTTITARALGGVDIGNAATVGLFTSDLSAVDPGFTKSECTNALLTSPKSGDLPKVWFSGAGGALADTVQVNVGVNNFANVTTAGHIASCDSTDTHYTSVYSGTLTNLLATKGSYANGIPWSLGFGGASTNNVGLKVTLSIPAGADANAIMGKSATFAANFENEAGT